MVRQESSFVGLGLQVLPANAEQAATEEARTRLKRLNPNIVPPKNIKFLGKNSIHKKYRFYNRRKENVITIYAKDFCASIKRFTGNFPFVDVSSI